MEKYSVLMSVYKNEQPDYLSEAIDSMINQTAKPDEIVLVEDGPLTKELYDIVELFCCKYPSLFTIVENEKNLGLGLSLNRGLQFCRNELVARMDTDDVSEPDRCEKQLRYFNDHPNIDIVGGQILEFDNRTNEIIGKRVVPLSDNEIKQFMKTRCPFNHMTVMLKKASVLEAGSYLDLFWNEDYYLWIRMALNDKCFANLSDVLVNVRSGFDLYGRRGGIKYFISELFLQNYLFNNSLIGPYVYLLNVLKRIIVQLLLPNTFRAFVFKHFARS